MYGQGSVIAGFSQDSDLDFVVVWHQMPTGGVMPTGDKFALHGELALDHLRINGYDVDVQHVPLTAFERWMCAFSRRGLVGKAVADACACGRWPC